MKHTIIMRYKKKKTKQNELTTLYDFDQKVIKTIFDLLRNIQIILTFYLNGFILIGRRLPAAVALC